MPVPADVFALEDRKEAMKDKRKATGKRSERQEPRLPSSAAGSERESPTGGRGEAAPKAAGKGKEPPAAAAKAAPASEAKSPAVEAKAPPVGTAEHAPLGTAGAAAAKPTPPPAATQEPPLAKRPASAQPVPRPGEGSAGRPAAKPESVEEAKAKSAPAEPAIARPSPAGAPAAAAAAERARPVRQAPLPPLADDDQVQAVIAADHRDPFAFLGMHALADDALVVRAFVPQARSVAVIDRANGKAVANLERIHPEGLFAGAILDRRARFPYRLRIETAEGRADAEDAYRFPPLLGEADWRRLAEGSDLHSYERLGAHPTTIEGVPGVAFAVWAPNAHRVAVVGEFNAWDGRRHGMRFRHECGVWELFVPEARVGQYYKYEIKAKPGAQPLQKVDPYAFRAERWPGSAAQVVDLADYHWGDRAWMTSRGPRNRRDAPIAIYEVHLGSWRRVPEEDNRWLTYRELAAFLPAYAKDMGFTHIEFLPLAEFNFEGAWGYQPTALFAPTGRFGSADDFRYLVDRCHQAGLGVILNWVAAQFADDPNGLVCFDGEVLYEHPDPLQRHHPRWRTLMYDYGRREVSAFLVSNALYWMDKYHVDGIRLHGLASILYLDYDRAPGEWTRNRFGGHENLEAVDFVRRLNEAVYAEFPTAMTMAEEESGWPMVSRPTFLGGLGFGFKWNEAWLRETLRYLSRNPVHRKYYHDEVTHGPTYAFQENHVLPLSHLEVVQGKGPVLARMPGNYWDKFAHLRLFYAFMYTQPGKKLVFMGDEFAHGREWNHEISLDWHLLEDRLHRGVQTLVRDLNGLYASTAALCELDCEDAGFAWIDCNDSDQSVVSYLRLARDGKGTVAVACNFTPVVRRGYRIGVPAAGFWAERLNTDAERYGGSNVGNAGGVEALNEPMHGRPFALALTLPPYSAVVLQHVDERPTEVARGHD